MSSKSVQTFSVIRRTEKQSEVKTSPPSAEVTTTADATAGTIAPLRLLDSFLAAWSVQIKYLGCFFKIVSS